MKTKKLYAGLVCAAAAAAASTIHAATLPTAVFDLRVHDTGGKQATVTDFGQSITLDLYVILNGIDSDPSNDKIQISTGQFLSSTGGLKIDLLGLRPPSPFDSSGFSIGAQNDLDSDGDLDVGSAGTSATGKYAMRTASTFAQPIGGFFMGRVQATVGAVTSAQTQLNFALRNTVSSGTFLAWYDNAGPGQSTSNVPGTVTISYGAPVTIVGQPPIDPGEIQSIGGVYNTHLTIDRNTRVTAGQSLTVNQGIDVVTGGTLDPAGATTLLNINDAISGNFGGTLAAGQVVIANTAPGTFTQASGSSLLGSVSLGGAGHAATLLINGGSLQGGAVSASAGAANTLIRQTGGVTNVSTVEMRGGSFEIAGGEFDAGQELRLGSGGAASLTLSAGTLAASYFPVGVKNTAGNPGRGTVQITGGTLRANPSLGGGASVGHVVQTGGTVLGGFYIVTNSTTEVSTYRIEAGLIDGSSAFVGQFIGSAGGGTFTQNGGDVKLLNQLQIASLPAVSARYEMNDGTLVAGGIRVGYRNPNGPPDYPGTLVQSGGSVATDSLRIAQTAVYSASAGTIRAKKELTLYGTLDLTGAAIALTVANGAMANFSGGQILNASNATFIGEQGSLMTFKDTAQLNSVGTINTLGLVHVAGQTLTIPAGKSIGGSGTIPGDVNNNGTVSPGNSPGVISITGNYTQSGLATLLMELAGTSTDPENPGFDTLTISGAASLDGLLSVALLDGFVPTAGMSFPIITAGSRTGTFDNTTVGISLPQGHFDVVYFSTGVTLTNFQTIPEPGAAAILSLCGLIGLRRRRR